MSLLQIHRNPEHPKLVRMGHAPVVIQSEPESIPAEVEAPLVAQPKNPRGRPKKMADKENFDKVGTKTIRQDDPGEQGAIGTHGENAPAQEKVPASGDDDKGESDNG